MTLAEDLFRRASEQHLFEGEISDSDGHPVRMYSVVTPVGQICQHYEAGAQPIVLEPGVKLVVLGTADGDRSLLWLQVDHSGHPWVNADVVLSSSDVRYLCEAGDDLHMKARH
ncbi:hypothetical protein [Brevundimonas sp.]|uniref:hypothetical protein n=1 Tax=Brevundimonas sp. TaxID=1871086 RepID=UPI002D35CB7B|nr:hypothetical protein [Brevundimonas sp.]HYD29116.1 hypothetical protein [Brevundimonas sp.]